MRKRLIDTLRAAGSPRRTAAAFALGVFLSFSPFLGVQIALVFGLAFALRLSRAVMFAGLCLNLPWLMLPWYTLATAGGAVMLGVPVSPEVGARLTRLFDLSVMGSAFWTQGMEIAAPFLWSFLFGSTAGALLLGAAAYLVVARYLIRAGWIEPVPDVAAVATEPAIVPADTER